MKNSKKIAVHHFTDVTEKPVIDVLILAFKSMSEHYLKSQGSKTYFVEVWA